MKYNTGDEGVDQILNEVYEKDLILKKYAQENKNKKEHIIFHGGCLGCSTPIDTKLETCFGCLYYNGIVSSYPDLSNKKR